MEEHVAPLGGGEKGTEQREEGDEARKGKDNAKRSREKKKRGTADIRPRTHMRGCPLDVACAPSALLSGDHALCTAANSPKCASSSPSVSWWALAGGHIPSCVR